MRGSGPPLVLLHGFTQTGRLWGPFGDLLAASRTLVAVDLPGHGESGSVRADLPTAASLVAEAVRTQIGDEPCALLGYSLGARVALHAAIAADLPLSHVVFIGVTAGIEDAAGRARRRQSDEKLADELEASGDVEGFIDALVARAAVRAVGIGRRRTEVRAPPQQRVRPGFQPAVCAVPAPRNRCGIASGPCPLPSWLWPGSDDNRFAAHALRLARLVPRGVASLVPGGGHAVHLAQPEQAGRIVRHWLDAVGPGSA